MENKLIRNKELVKPNRKIGKRISKDIVFYKYATLLIDQLDENQYFERLKSINQLGNIKISKKDIYSRHDYVSLQLYLNSLAQDFNDEMVYSYCNDINNFKNLSKYYSFVPLILDNKVKHPSIADCIQCLCIVYNIGHFNNTFTSSRSLLYSIRNNEVINNRFLSFFKNINHKELVMHLIEKDDYHNIHLLNSLLLLLNVNEPNEGVIFSINLISIYLENILGKEIDPKVKYAFEIYRKIRNLSYIIYDLNIAPISLSLNIDDEKSIKRLIWEMISEYNNSFDSNSLITSIHKLLSDSVYNNYHNVINQYRISRKISSKFTLNEFPTECRLYLKELLISDKSIFNIRHSLIHKFDKNHLKITFNQFEQIKIVELTKTLNSMNFVHAGYYYRRGNSHTLIVAISDKCIEKKSVAFRVCKRIISELNSIQGIHNNDSRFLLIAKYLLFYLFNEFPLKLKSEIDVNKCVLLSNGNKNRVKLLNSIIINNSDKDEDKLHEIIWIRNVLEDDSNKDRAILIPCSILLSSKNKNNNLCEFDGAVIFINRTNKQLYLFEAKNGESTSTQAKRELNKKLENICFNEYIDETVDDVGDICYKISIN